MLRKKLLSIGADFTIKDDAGQDRFFVDGKAFTLRDRMIFQDMQGNELVSIQKKLLSWGTTYEIYHGEALVATAKEAIFTLLGHRFSIHDEAGNPRHGADDLEARGNFTDHQYTFTRGGREVASVSEKWFTIADTYGVDVESGENDVLILACAVVIERCQAAARASQHTT